MLLSALMACGLPGASAASNFLVVILDDVGIDKIAAYDRAHDPGRTPNINALAREGVLFRNAWASPTCTPSRASALTGLRPELTGLGFGLTGQPGLASDELTLAKVLAGEGYATAAIGKWHLGKHPTKPLDLGFDTHRGTRNNIGDYRKWRKFIDGVDQGWQNSYATTDTADDAIEWIEEQQGPWFVWLGFQAAHGPLHAPPTRLHSYGLLLESAPATQYKAMLEALDTEFGRVLAAAGSDTTVVLIADNGTYARAIEPPFDPRHGKGTPYDVSINVPLIVSGPAVASQNRGTKTEALVHVSDIFATVAELAGSAATATDSVSFVPQLNEADAPGRPWVYTSGFQPNGGPPAPSQYQRAARDARYKLIRVGTQVELLFDLVNDPYEQTNLLEGRLDLPAQEARARLTRVIESQQWGSTPATPPSQGQWGTLAVLALAVGMGLLILLVRRSSSKAAPPR